TCSMCSNAINKAIQKLSFVESVRVDIRNSKYTISFKEGATISIDGLKQAVEDAGFSVGKLNLSGNFDKIALQKDEHIKIGNDYFHFLSTNPSELSGNVTVQVVDKGFVTAKQFKKFSSSTKMACAQTGRAENCCTKDGVAEGARIYHVTI
ncbi:MAG: heavy-metal-associated domain-containing protein, partial [Pedobacter sp.]